MSNRMLVVWSVVAIILIEAPQLNGKERSWFVTDQMRASVLANVVMCGVVLRVSGRLYTIPFSAPRLGGILALAVGLFAASSLAGGLPGLGWMILMKIAMVLLFPAVVVFGFFTSEERSRIRSLVRDLYNRGG